MVCMEFNHYIVAYRINEIYHTYYIIRLFLYKDILFKNGLPRV